MIYITDKYVTVRKYTNKLDTKNCLEMQTVKLQYWIKICEMLETINPKSHK